MKKFFVVMMSLIMMVCFMPMVAFATEGNEVLTSDGWDGVSVDTEWYNDAGTTFNISTAAQLAGLAKLVNEGNNFSGKTITIGDDIDLANKEWTPIGNGSKSFNGTFDGQNHTISNLKITTRYNGYGNGFFRQMNGTVKNVTFDGANVLNDSTNITGIVAGYTAYYSMTTVYENVTVKNSTVEGYGKVGAIAGMTEDRGGSHIVLKNCSVQDTIVKGTYDMGGVIGLVQGTIDLSGTTTKNVTFVTSGTHVKDKVKVTCEGGPATCAGKDTIVEGDFWVYGGCYWGGYADFYVKYGDSSHDCTLEGSSYKLANSEIPSSAAVTIYGAYGVKKYASQDDARVDNPEFDTVYAAKNGTRYYSNADDAITDAASGDTIYLKQPTAKGKTLEDGQSLTIVSEAEGAVWTGAVAGEGVRIKSEPVGNTTIYSAEVDPAKAAAKVGDVYYATLGAAFKDTTSGKVEVLKNVDLGSSYIAIGTDKDITLELNGYTVEGNAEYVFNLSSTGKLTVQDSSTDETGTIKGNGKYALRTGSKTATVVVNSGTVTGSKYGLYGYYGGNITVKDGRIIGGERGLDMYDEGTCNLNGGAIGGGKYSVYVRHSKAIVNITGGMYSGAVYKESGTVSISGGYFTNDPTAYLASGKALVDSGKVGFAYKVGVPAKVGKAEVHPAPDTTPAANIDNITDENDKTAVENAIKGTSSTGLNAVAAAVAENTSKVTETDVQNGLAEVKSAIDGSVSSADEIKLVVQPYLDIAAQSFTTTDEGNKELAVEITPKYNLLATKIDTDIKTLDTTSEDKNAVVVSRDNLLPVDQDTQVTISFQLPSGFITDDAQMNKVFVVHTKKDGSKETYKANVTKSGDKYIATFTTNGFSPFVFMVDSRTATVTFDGTPKTFVASNVGESLPTSTAPTDKIFGGWTFDGIDGTYTTLTDELLTALNGRTVTATPYFYTPNYGGGGIVTTPLDKAKSEASKAVSEYVKASDYEAAEQAEIKEITEKAIADIKNAKTEAEVKTIEAAAKAELDKLETAEEMVLIRTIEATKFKARSKATTLNGKKAIRVTWNVPEGIDFDGFEIYRSTEKYKGFGTKPIFTSKTQKYTNNKGLKVGKTYYYKVRAFKYVNDEKVYTEYSYKAIRTVK